MNLDLTALAELARAELPGALFVTAAAAGGLAAVLARRRSSPAVFVLLAVLAGLAVGTCAAAVRGLAREGSPLHPLAQQGRTVEVLLELADIPRSIAGVGPPRVVADATVTAVEDGAAVARTGDAVLLFAPAEGWADLAPGTRVRVRATVSPPRTTDAFTAVLTARGPPRPSATNSTILLAPGSRSSRISS